MNFIYELDPYPLNMYPQAKNELSTSRLSKVIVLRTGIQTDRQISLKLLQCRFAGDNKDYHGNVDIIDRGTTG